ncbi:chemotaxis protein CheA [Luteimonas yindakuii]|uniref:chemotaxis protein CheA n=1 Tax=Luteimonas yindakuii TaxID=2565782 RepID=UPI0011078C9C|nr:chemotaxis protein CheA [Luteimonas yindakuii]QCU72556.1 chemotaxis protein CheA [Luteimonas yindakuii]
MSIDLQRFHATYFEESREGLDAMEAGLLALDAGERGAELINSVFRAAHSIKGGAATFGFTATAELTHVLETLLDQIRAGERAVEAGALDAMLGSVDVLRALLDEAEHQRPADPAQVQAVHQRLAAVLGGTPVPVAAEATAAADAGGSVIGWRIGFQPEPSLFMSGNDPLRILRELEELGPLRVEASLAALPAFDALDPLQAHIGWTLELGAPVKRAAIDDVFAWVADECRLEIEPIRQPVVEVDTAGAAAKGSGAQDAESSIRVGVDKIDGLINLVGELVITQSMLQQLGAGLDGALAERMQAALEQLERNTRDLQDAVIGVRMLPVDAVFRRFPRLVRDLSGRLGKLVRLQTSGEATELDKGLIEKIADPLVHLVRNAIDHGLEDPATRSGAGKEPTGTISLAASHQDGHIVIEVGDDGRGLDRNRILAKARERGLVVPEQPTDAQVWDLIFQAGFSTADAVTDLSGRGVGMDVVRSNIRQLGGSVQLESHLGRGTRVTIRLPLTLAILDGMTVSVGNETLVLPLTHVREALQPGPGDVRTVKGQGRMLKVRDEYLPLLSLGDTYGYGRAGTDALVAVVVEGDGRRLAVEVDALLGQQQVVVKSLERNYRRVEGISGATILGDGRVALIVDVGGLARSRRVPQAA